MKKIRFYMTIYIIVLAQLLSILRATQIYNTSILITTLIGLNGILFFICFLVKFLKNKKKISKNELLLLLYLTTNFIISVFIYRNDVKEAIIDMFNFLIFISILNFRFEFILNKNKEKIYKVLITTLSLSLLTYYIALKIGYNVGVGKTSIQYIYIYIYELLYRKNSYISILLILYAQKRGIILSIIAIWIVYKIYFNKKRSRLIKTGLILSSFFIGIFFIKFNSELENIKYVPNIGKAMFVKFNRINPLKVKSTRIDPRVVEVESAMKKVDSKYKLLFGLGLGKTYQIKTNNDQIVIKKNIHISPLSLIFKIGILGMSIFYILIFKLLVRVKFNNLNKIQKFSYLYVVGGLINSITAYTYFVDYLFVICLSIVKYSSIKNKKGEKDVR